MEPSLRAPNVRALPIRCAIRSQREAGSRELQMYEIQMVRKDGRVIHDMYLFEVKSPAQSTGPWDYYNLKRTVPAAEAFRPMNAGGCSLV